MSMQSKRRRRRYDELIGDDSIYDRDSITPDNLDRYVLIERSRFDSDVYVTSWETPEDASDYHDNQEYADDWIVEKLVDLDTSKTLEPTSVTQWSN